jgi:hypothetical protein
MLLADEKKGSAPGITLVKHNLFLSLHLFPFLLGEEFYEIAVINKAVKKGILTRSSRFT